MILYLLLILGVAAALESNENSSLESSSGLSPEFHSDNSTERNVTVQQGDTAFLHCRIQQLGDRTVSWIRRKDGHLLTVGQYTYTVDQRFRSIHFENSGDWIIQIVHTMPNDAGIYECHVNTEPTMSLSVVLNVFVPETNILEGSDVFVKSGSNISLTCVISGSPPAYIFWAHEDRIINYDSTRDIVISMDSGPPVVSQLLIANLKPTDSGNYSCKPSSADPASIAVHVLNSERPVAMQLYSNSNVVETPSR